MVKEVSSPNEITRDITANWTVTTLPDPESDEFYWLMALGGVDYNRLSTVSGQPLWNNHRVETVITQRCKLAINPNVQGIVGSFSHGHDKFREGTYELFQNHQELSEWKRGFHKQKKLYGILGRPDKSKRFPIWQSPTMVGSSPSRGETIADWISEIPSTQRRSLIELGSGADFNLAAIARRNIFSETIGIDALSVKEAINESSMEVIRETINLPDYLISLKNFRVNHIKANIFNLHSVKDQIGRLSRPLTVLFSSVLMYYTSPKINEILESTLNELKPEYVAIHEGLQNQGIEKFGKATHKEIYKIS